MDSARGTYQTEQKSCAVLVGKHEERDHFKHLGMDERIILKWLLKK
jgi:hypothetical protein